MSAPVLHTVDGRGVATIALNRPEVHNAYDATLLIALREALATSGADPAVRIILLRGLGRHFQSGVDLRALRRLAEQSEADNDAFSTLTMAALRSLCDVAKPTLALVHGACFGAGVGLVASCDMAIASDDAVFALSEVHIGIPPAPIAPQLLDVMGLRATLSYSLTGRRFGAAEAQRNGLVSAVCPAGGLDKASEEIIEGVLRGGPQALGETKRLLRRLGSLAIDEVTMRDLVALTTSSRRSAEGREGFASFLERRQPLWPSHGS